MGTRIFLIILFFPFWAAAQPERWQQRVDYQMEVDFDVATHRFTGTQRLVYTNNSPDTLYKIFYHLYYNAFRPGSMMYTRHANIPDGDGRLKRITSMQPDETGWVKVVSLQQDGVPLAFETNETILEVPLAVPILPSSRCTLQLNWETQTPVMIRRAGRESMEGVAYSMAQWYPKLCNYDYQGWHANPYIGREFYGVWGDFDVKISIDRRYLVAAGGVLQNPLEVGNGYEAPGSTLRIPSGEKLTYHFRAENVHDFVWAADPDYTHRIRRASDGTELHFIWKKGKGYDEQWEQLPAIMDRALAMMNERFGKYPYPVYYFIQGGDGGMEYPLATLITGNRPLKSLVGVAVHEQLHSWYQMILGTNESLHAWMDEGFTSYAETIVENELAREGLIPGRDYSEDPFDGTLSTYQYLTKSGKEEPLSTHADHFKTNFAYSMAAYVKGAVFMHQLEYIVGKDAHRRALLRYFETWKFKHPNPNDLIRVFEKESGLELDWYKEDMVYTTRTIDYAVGAVAEESRKSTRITISRNGEMAMPLDIEVTYADGRKELYYAPLESMRGEKPAETRMLRTVLPDHRWVDPEYTFVVPEKINKIRRIEIDPSRRMADVDLENNIWEK